MSECTCLCVLVLCRGALSCTAVCDCPFQARWTLRSHVSCASAARRLPSLREKLSLSPAARTVTGPLPVSHEHEVPSLLLSLVSCCFQVAPRTCVRCPRASLPKGVTLRRLPIPPALVRASPGQQPFSRRFEKHVCATVGACRSVGCQFHRRYFMLAVCPQNCLSISFIGIWVVAHTSPPDVHVGCLVFFFKKKKDLPRDRTSCKSYTCCVASGVSCTCGEKGTVHGRSNEKTRPTQNNGQTAPNQARQVGDRGPPLSTHVL